MSLKHILLGILQEPKSGYDVKKKFDEVFSNFWAAELSQIYPQLKKMSEQGWLNVQSQESDKGPNKKIYQTTQTGREQLLEWLSNGPVVHTERLTYLAQIFFLDGLKNKQDRLDFMAKLHQEMQQWHLNLQGIENDWKTEHSNFPMSLSDEEFYPYLTLSMGIKKVGSIVQWLEESMVLIAQRD